MVIVLVAFRKNEEANSELYIRTNQKPFKLEIFDLPYLCQNRP